MVTKVSKQIFNYYTQVLNNLEISMKMRFPGKTAYEYKEILEKKFDVEALKNMIIGGFENGLKSKDVAKNIISKIKTPIILLVK